MQQIIKILIAIILSGCYWEPADFKSEIIDVPVVKNNPVLITIARRDSEDSIITHPIVWIDLDSCRIAKLENNEYTQFHVSMGEHLLGLNWLESERDIVTDTLSAFVYMGLFTTTQERSRWHLLQFDDTSKNLLILSMTGESYFEQRRAVSLNRFDKWPSDLVLDDLKFVAAGKK